MRVITQCIYRNTLQFEGFPLENSLNTEIPLQYSSFQCGKSEGTFYKFIPILFLVHSKIFYKEKKTCSLKKLQQYNKINICL